MTVPWRHVLNGRFLLQFSRRFSINSPCLRVSRCSTSTVLRRRPIGYGLPMAEIRVSFSTFSVARPQCVKDLHGNEVDISYGNILMITGMRKNPSSTEEIKNFFSSKFGSVTYVGIFPDMSRQDHYIGYVVFRAPHSLRRALKSLQNLGSMKLSNPIDSRAIVTDVPASVTQEKLQARITERFGPVFNCSVRLQSDDGKISWNVDFVDKRSATRCTKGTSLYIDDVSVRIKTLSHTQHQLRGELKDKKQFLVHNLPLDIELTKVVNTFSHFGELYSVNLSPVYMGEENRCTGMVAWVTYDSDDQSTADFFKDNVIFISDNMLKISEFKDGTSKPSSALLFMVEKVPAQFSEGQIKRSLKDIGEISFVRIIGADEHFKTIVVCFIGNRSLNPSALEAKQPKGAENMKIKKLGWMVSTFSDEDITKRICIDKLQANITVEKLVEGLNQNSQLVSVDLSIDPVGLRAPKAFITFQDNVSITSLLKPCQSHFGKAIKVRAVHPMVRSHSRKRKLLIEGYEERDNPDSIRNYLSQFGEISRLFPRVESCQNVKWFVECSSVETVENIMAQKEHFLSPHKLTIKQLGWAACGKQYQRDTVLEGDVLIKTIRH